MLVHVPAVRVTTICPVAPPTIVRLSLPVGFGAEVQPNGVVPLLKVLAKIPVRLITRVPAIAGPQLPAASWAWTQTLRVPSGYLVSSLTGKLPSNVVRLPAG